jgi:hypothetical protein
MAQDISGWLGEATARSGRPVDIGLLFAFGGAIGGFFVGWRLMEAFDRRFRQPDAGIPAWHGPVIVALMVGTPLVGCVVGIVFHDVFISRHSLVLILLHGGRRD